mgnify:CR=1 FL=1
MKMLFLIAALSVFPQACRAEDPRIAESEAIAEETCGHLVCAFEAGGEFIESRGLEQEDYENLSQDEIDRFTAAYDAASLCIRRQILE